MWLLNLWPSSCWGSTSPRRHCKLLTVTSITPKGRGILILEVLQQLDTGWPPMASLLVLSELHDFLHTAHHIWKLKDESQVLDIFTLLHWSIYHTCSIPWKLKITVGGTACLVISMSFHIPSKQLSRCTEGWPLSTGENALHFFN